jgi:hypothetical protein
MFITLHSAARTNSVKRIFRHCADGKYDRVPKVYWNYMAVYVYGTETIYAMKSLLSYLSIESYEMNSHGNASFFGQTGSDLK